MGWSGNKLTYPFTKIAANGSGDLQRALGRTNDYSMSSIFSNGYVNMFAKYKAFKNSSSFSDRYGDSGSSRKSALSNANYGIYIPTFTSLGTPGGSGTFFYSLLNSLAMWSYDRPTSYYRALDFEGYYSSASTITLPLSTTSYSLNGQNQLIIQWPEATIASDEDGQLLFTHLKLNGTAMSNCYFGALLYYNSSTYTWVANQQLSAGKTVTFTSMSGYAGKTVKVVPFISTIAIGQGQSPSNALSLCSFNVAPSTITIGANVPNWSTSSGGINWNLTGTKVSYTIHCSNNTSSSRTMTFYVWLTDDTSSGSTHLVNASATTITVAGNSTQDISGNLTYTKDSRSFAVACEGSYNGEYVQMRLFSIMSPMPADN